MIWFLFRLGFLAFCVYAMVVVVHRAFHYLRGRRTRDSGIPCVDCHGMAFPVDGSISRYRCWGCGCRFDGPEHF